MLERGLLVRKKIINKKLDNLSSRVYNVLCMFLEWSDNYGRNS
jgi:hypothetical protein